MEMNQALILFYAMLFKCQTTLTDTITSLGQYVLPPTTSILVGHRLSGSLIKWSWDKIPDPRPTASALSCAYIGEQMDSPEQDEY